MDFGGNLVQNDVFNFSYRCNKNQSLKAQKKKTTVMMLWIHKIQTTSTTLYIKQSNQKDT